MFEAGAGARLVAAADVARRRARADGHLGRGRRRVRGRRGRHLPRADLRRAHRGRVPVGYAALAHRHREPGVPGAVRDGRDARRPNRPTATSSRSTARPSPASCGSRREQRLGRDDDVDRLDSLPQRDLVHADDGAHRARVGVDSRERVHRDRVRRVLPPLSGDHRRDQPRRCRPRSSGAPGIA